MSPPPPPPALDPFVLVVSQDEEERAAISDLLANEGFQSLTAASGGEADLALRAEAIELIILHGRLGDGGALAVCQRMAASETAPIIMISESLDLAERVIALEVGADELLSPRYDRRELVARARALVRRSRKLLKLPQPGSSETAGNAASRTSTFNTRTRQLAGPTNEKVSLTPGEAALLELFLSRPGQILDADKVSASLAGGGWLHAHLRVAVYRLRRKLARAGLSETSIRSVKSDGYYLDLEIAGAVAVASDFTYLKPTGGEQARHAGAPGVRGLAG